MTIQTSIWLSFLSGSLVQTKVVKLTSSTMYLQIWQGQREHCDSVYFGASGLSLQLDPQSRPPQPRYVEACGKLNTPPKGGQQSHDKVDGYCTNTSLILHGQALLQTLLQSSRINRHRFFVLSHRAGSSWTEPASYHRIYRCEVISIVSMDDS